jgi:hypothetical protein
MPKPSIRKDIKAVGTKNVLKPVDGGQKWPGRSTLRKEVRPDGPQTQPDTGGLLYKTQDADGRWNTSGQLAEKQPMAGPGHSVTKQVLSVMPEDVIGPATTDKQMGLSPLHPLQQPSGEKTELTVRSTQHDFDARVDIFNKA